MAQTTTKAKPKKSASTKSGARKTTSAKSKTTSAKKSTARKPRVSKPVVVSHDDIALRAYQIWMEKGQPVGEDVINWQQAEAELSTAA